MAIDEIITSEGQPMEMDFDRGDVGTIVDEVSMGFNQFEIPEVTGGGSSEHSYVF